MRMQLKWEVSVECKIVPKPGSSTTSPASHSTYGGGRNSKVCVYKMIICCLKGQVNQQKKRLCGKTEDESQDSVSRDLKAPHQTPMVVPFFSHQASLSWLQIL